MAKLKKIHEAILKVDLQTTVDITKEALEGKIDLQSIIRKYMIPAMDLIGEKFERNEVFILELLMAARAMKGSLELLRPRLVETGAKPVGKVIIGTVKGDLHDIGKNIVASMLEGSGFEVIDLGVDVQPEKFIQTVKEKDVKIVALSALLTTTMPAMKVVIDALKDAGLRDKVKVMIGGPAITQSFAEEISADGYSENANGAVGLARSFIM